MHRERDARSCPKEREDFNLNLPERDAERNGLGCVNRDRDNERWMKTGLRATDARNAEKIGDSWMQALSHLAQAAKKLGDLPKRP